MMKFPPTLFRESLIAKMDEAGITAAELSRRTGVSKTKIDKLRQRVTVETTVSDAIIMANFFGMTVEELMGLSARQAAVDQLMALIARLTPEQSRMLQAQIQGLLALRG